MHGSSTRKREAKLCFEHHMINFQGALQFAIIILENFFINTPPPCIFSIHVVQLVCTIIHHKLTFRATDMEMSERIVLLAENCGIHTDHSSLPRFVVRHSEIIYLRYIFSLGIQWNHTGLFTEKNLTHFCF